MKSSAETANDYVASLPVDRRRTIAAVRAVMRKALPKGYVEAMDYGMICYLIPLSDYPNTYNGRPLVYAAIASQKQYCALYLTCAYSDPEVRVTLEKAFADTGKPLRMGKTCIRFHTEDDLPLAGLGKLIRSTSPRKFIEHYERARGIAGAKTS